MVNHTGTTIKFNHILHDEMSSFFTLKPLPLAPEFKSKYTDDKDKSVHLTSEYLDCPKTAGVRIGQMDFGESMVVHFGSVPPAENYSIPILGFTFVFASKFLIAVLDLHPVLQTEEYTETYITPLKSLYQKYAWIPKAEGGRSEVHDWAKQYDSGYALYRWCDRQYLVDIENAFRDYVHVFCQYIQKAEPIKDTAMLARRNEYLRQYRYDYAYKDPGSSPLKAHFGEEWGERFMKDFLFAP